MIGAGWRTPGEVLACSGVILMLSLGTRQSFGLFLAAVLRLPIDEREMAGIAVKKPAT